MVNDQNTVKQVNHYYPFGGLFGASTNGAVQKYKYNEKELERMYGLDWYNYGFRFMDPVGRMGFLTMDHPMAEKYYSISPYAHCLNNPVRYVDPDGRKIVIGTLWRLKGAFGLDTYVSKVKTQLLQNNMDSRRIESVYKQLEESKLVYKILPIPESPFKTEKKVGNHVIPDSNIERSKKQGGTMYYDPEMQTTPNGSKRNPRIGLAHEMGHLEDLMNGTVIPFDNEKVKEGNKTEIYKKALNETNSMELENIIRKILDYPIREKY